METRVLGKKNSLTVSEVGFGCMGFSHGYGPGPGREEGIKLLRFASDQGCTFFDTAESYGAGDNERLVGEALKPFRKDVVLATKLHIPTGRDLEAAIREHLEVL